MGIAPEKSEEQIQRSNGSNSDKARLESVMIETVATVHESCSPKDACSMDSFEAVLESTRLVELTRDLGEIADYYSAVALSSSENDSFSSDSFNDDEPPSVFSIDP